MLPNIPSKLFSMSAVVVGYILIDDMTANEQNAVSNWLMLVAQVLATNAFYRAVMQERGLEPRESTETGRNNADTFANSSSGQTGGDDNNRNSTQNNESGNEETLAMLEKMVRAMQTEIDNIKRNL